jgi:hypothetical protein
MGRLALFSTLLLVCACSLRAQNYPANGCFRDRSDNPPFKKKLWQGYEISLGPVRDGEAEEKCTAAIYRADGKVVYRTTGFNVVFDAEHTGLDFDGDGKPEVVFKTDSGGGNHCCWAYNIISLSPKPRHLFDIDEQGAVRFEKDQRGRLIIWKGTGGPYGFTSMARQPFAEKVLQVRDGKLSDITPEYCGVIFGDQSEDSRDWKEALTDANLERLRKTGESDWNNEDIVSALLSKALQHVFCRQFDEAVKELDRWPAPSRAKMKQDFAQAVKADYPQFASRLAASPN